MGLCVQLLPGYVHMHDIVIPAVLLKHLTACPLCEEPVNADINSLDSIPGSARYRKYSISIEGEITLDQCSKCGLSYKNPITKPDFEKYLSEYIDNSADERWGGLSSLRFDQWISEQLRGRQTILEISPGYFSTVRKLANDYYVLDPGYDADTERASAHSQRVFRARIDSDELGAECPKMSFDAVVLLDVAEHVFNPKIMMTNIKRFLKPGGICLITTGNMKRATMPRGQWWYVRVPEHRVFWSHSSFKWCCNNFGFSIESFSEEYHRGINQCSWKIYLYSVFFSMRRYFFPFMFPSLDEFIFSGRPQRDQLWIALKRL